ncbi:glycerophosphoryl diester phosphodiesterase membrane domain-containing protein [Daejeonella sp.]|uniref:glycerophosphoryl diester phosphodiesterase membrane domain-containing protein n=1 Tax=Daejeonella sp. TaxID=2805397 RepID=UPI003982F962
MGRVITVKEVFMDSWRLAKDNMLVLLGLTVFQFAIIFIISLLAVVLGNASGLLLTLFDAFYTVAFYQVFFKLIDDPKDASFPDVVPNLVKAFNFLLVKLVISLVLVFMIAVISSVYFFNTPQIEIDPENPFSWEMLPIFILISIPITYFTIRLCFVVAFIVDQESGSSESISQSWTLTKGHFWFILRLFLLMLGVNILGAMALGLGTLFSVPFSSIILIIAYRHMVNNYADEEEILLDDVVKSDGN